MAFSYDHPFAEKIAEDSLKILAYSDKARHLLDFLGEAPYSVHILRLPLSQPFTPDAAQIFLSVPVTQDFADIEQALDLAAALVELRQNREGYVRPVSDFEREENRQKQHLKNLDILLDVFEIAVELEDAGYRAEEVLRKGGFGKLLNAWKKNADYKEFINLYWSIT